MDAALIAGVNEAPARAGINGQIHADTEQLSLLADAAHVLAFGDAFAQPPQVSPLLRGEQVDEFHWSSSGGERGASGGACTDGRWGPRTRVTVTFRAALQVLCPGCGRGRRPGGRLRSVGGSVSR